MEVEKPIEVTASPLAAQLMAALRVSLIGAGMSIVTNGALDRADMEIIVGAVLTAGVFIWSQISTRLAHKRAVITARAAPNKVAVVKE